MIGIRFNRPFEEQLAFFNQKGFAFSPDSWRDLWEAAHSRAFTVAGVTEMDVLADIREALEKAMADGIPFQTFRENLAETLEARGWLAPTGERAKVIMPDGMVRKRLTGWRLRTIFETNTSTSYSVGRYKQLQEVKDLRPYWVYMTDEGPNVRDTHAAHHGEVRHADHPFWNAWYPPNGFNCHCYVRSLSARQMNSQGLKETVRGTDTIPDEGFAYNPGKAGLDAWQPDMERYTDQERSLLQAVIAHNRDVQRFD